MSPTKHLRIAVAQSTVPVDPGDVAQLRAAGHEVRGLMRRAHAAGARLIHLAEGALCAPDKHLMSRDPDRVGPADWDRCDWGVLHEQLTATARLAGELGLWTVVGSVHRLTAPRRPHSSLYVVSDRGELVTRYDERRLSSTKVRFLYTPGAVPTTFEVDGMRFGCALGMEATYPEIFLEYERLGVDAVLFSTHGPGTSTAEAPFALQCRAHAASNSYWVSYAGTAQGAVDAPSGVVGLDGRWLGRCAPGATSDLVVVDLDDGAENLARPWRRTARGGVYDEHLAHDDPRSDDRTSF